MLFDDHFLICNLIEIENINEDAFLKTVDSLDTDNHFNEKSVMENNAQTLPHQKEVGFYNISCIHKWMFSRIFKVVN